VYSNLSSRLVAGDHAASTIWRKLEGTSSGTRMPKNNSNTWSQAQLDMLATWIDEGAPNN